jgi:hypothetical protein
MDENTRNKYLAMLTDRDKEKVEDIAQKIKKKAEECLNDILTLTVSTRYEGEDHVAARTELHFDGDIDMILPKSGSGIDRETLDFHLQTVALAVKNRRELIRIFAELFDLKEVVKLI